MSGVVFDEPRPLTHDRFVEIQRLRNRRGERPQADQVASPRRDGPLRTVPQQEQRLAPEVGARIARHGKHVDIRRREAAHLQAGGDRVVRKTRHVLDAAEPLLFNRRDKLSVADQRRRHVAVIRVEAENVHGVSDTMAFDTAPDAVVFAASGNRACSRRRK